MAGKTDRVKDSNRFSIISNINRCYVCGTKDNLHIHEVFGGSNRAKSKEYGMVIALCGPHHNMSSAGIHFNKGLDEHVKKQAEKYWILEYCDKNLSAEEKIKEFIKVFGKNYLEEDEVL